MSRNVFIQELQGLNRPEEGRKGGEKGKETGETFLLGKGGNEMGWYGYGYGYGYGGGPGPAVLRCDGGPLLLVSSDMSNHEGPTLPVLG